MVNPLSMGGEMEGKHSRRRGERWWVFSRKAGGMWWVISPAEWEGDGKPPALCDEGL